MKSRDLKQSSSPNLQLAIGASINIALLYFAVLMIQLGSLYGLVFSQLLLAILYFRSFTLFHDASHGLAHPKTWVNNLTGFLTSIFCFLPFWPWKTLHLEHHKWTGNLKKDPVLSILKKYPLKSNKVQKIISLIWNSWIPFLALNQYLVFWSEGHKIVTHKNPLNNQIHSLLSYLILLFTYSLTCFYFGTSLFILFLPSFICYLVLVEVVNFPHHLSLNKHTESRPASPLNQFRFCRSCHHSFFVSYFLFCNFNYHTEHHMFPCLPWYQLHKIKQDTMKAVGVSYNKSSGFQWILKNRNKNFSNVMYGEPENDRSSSKAA